METTKINTPTTLQYLTLGLFVLLACFALFLLDKDMHGITDLFKPGNLFALIYYFPPAFLISALLFKYTSRNQNRSNSFIISLALGIPIGFILIISILNSIMH